MRQKSVIEMENRTRRRREGALLGADRFLSSFGFFLNAWPYRPHERNSDLQLERSCKRTATNVEDGRTDGW